MTAPSITVEYVDPSTLLVDLNVRSEAQLDKDFLASIRDLGVLVPIVAVRATNGSLRVRFGKRRTLASVQVGQPLVPAVIVGAEDADDVARIVSQWHENEYRSGLGTKDKLAAVEQLSLLGLSAAQIVKRTKAGKHDVDQALAASRSDLAKGATQRYEFLTLDQAAAVAEFEATPAIVKALVAASNKSDGDFRHVLQRARDDRADAAALAALTEQLTAAGVAVIDKPDHGQRITKVLSELVTPDDAKLSPDSHHGCPGHAAYLGHTFRRIEATHVCLDWKANGHRDRYNATSRPTGPPMDDQAKAERREIITRNREWKSATVVRREFLRALVARKTPPKATAIYVATELAYGTAALRRAMEHAHDLAATLLGADESHTRQAIAALSHNGSDARAQVITLGMVLGAIEQSLDTHTWRNPTDTVKRYFEFLATNGYTLTEVEQIAAGTHKRPRRRTRSGTPTTSEQAAA